MIAKIDSPITNFKFVIDYHENKVEEGKAILIFNNTGEEKRSDYISAFEDVCKQKSGVRNKGFHISLNLPHNENMSGNKFTELAQDYIQGMGLENCPYLIYKHSDKEHNHIHIITTTIDCSGEKINWDFYKLRSQKLSRELESKYNLTPTIYYKFNNENLQGLNERKYFFHNALKKALRSYSTKSEIEKSLSKEEISYIFKNNLSNKDLENVLGEERYNTIGAFLEKNHLFSSLYKDTLTARLDKIYQKCTSKGGFLKEVEKDGIYIRHLSDKGKSYYVYGFGDAAFYVKDSRLPLKYRYNEQSKSFTSHSAYIPNSEQRHIIYNRVMLSLRNTSTLDNFLSVLEKSGVSVQRIIENDKPEYLFKLRDSENPVDIKLSELSKRVDAYSIETNFLSYKDILSETTIKEIAHEESHSFILDTAEAMSVPMKKRKDDAPLKKKKKRGIGDTGRER